MGEGRRPRVRMHRPEQQGGAPEPAIIAMPGMRPIGTQWLGGNAFVIPEACG